LINIERNTANDVALTLTEKGTATYYLFKFQSDNTEAVEYCVATDSSLYPERFNTGLTELESGIVKVTGTTTPVTTYSGGNSNYVVYGS